jgi:hypothetical protein
MGQRLKLQSLLETLMGDEPELKLNVYFQPPSNLTMEYPCIVYNRDRARTRFAGNNPYNIIKGYEVTVIDRNPDSLIPDKVAELPMCEHTRFFVAENLNHDVFTLFF